MEKETKLTEAVIDTTLLEGNWYKYPNYINTELKIRHCGIFSMNKLPSEKAEENIQNVLGTFIYAVVDWRGFKSKDGKVFECNDDNKKILAELDENMILFVLQKVKEIRENAIVTEKETKNLSTSQTGETQNTEQKPVVRNV